MSLLIVFFKTEKTESIIANSQLQHIQILLFGCRNIKRVKYVSQLLTLYPAIFAFGLLSSSLVFSCISAEL